MKPTFLLLLLSLSLAGSSQTKDEIKVLANVRSLHRAVFADKDRAAIERLFGSDVTYGHSSGKVENRSEALSGIAGNKSTYANLEMGPVHLVIRNKTAVSRHTMTAMENTADGKQNPLKLHILLVWVKEKKEWKMISRQAVRVP